jgi:hypothetical protein
MRPQRDFQRSKVYAWERHVTGLALHQREFETLEDCAAFLAPIWKAERARYKPKWSQKKEPPHIVRPSWGQQHALSYEDGRISLPLWARNRWIILHEALHQLMPAMEHGPRFVGSLIGMASRHLDYDPAELMAAADEMGVKYDVRSIGLVPAHGLAWKLRKAITKHGPMSEMDAACWLDVSYLQIRGAALSMIGRGQARWLRGKLVLLDKDRKLAA